MTAAAAPHKAASAGSQPRRRVLQIVNSLDPGGVLTLADLVQEGLSRRGFLVETRVFSKSRADGGAAKLEGVASIIADMLRVRYDAVLAYQAFACCLAGTVGRLSGIQHRIAHQTALPEEIKPHWRRLDRLIGTIGGYTTNVANTCTTRLAYERYPPSYRARMTVVPHGLVPLDVTRGRAETRAAFGLPQDVALALAPGRQTDQKNQRVLVEALPAAPNLHLAIAGDGPLRDSLMREAYRLDVAERYHPLGDVPRAEMGNLIATADAVLFPSVWETFGLAAVEAAMLGAPLFAADLPVLREVLRVDGLEPMAFLPPHDAAAWGEVMRLIRPASVLNEPPLAYREAVRRAHGLDAMIDRYVALLGG